MLLALAENQQSVVMILAACGVIFTWIIAATIHAVKRDRQREQTRREIAAYVAEGSMSAEQGERLLAAKPNDSRGT
ncbi:MAG: hypothetical protein H6811_03420 [Phycisphaeraceae bacterium]|nr:hypothetical protein [Phycisphaeraceae bacterium]